MQTTTLPATAPLKWGKKGRYMRPAHEFGYALVTGATSGFGRDLAGLLVRDNWNVVITSRSDSDLALTKAQLLEINPQVQIVCVSADLAEINGPEHIVRTIQSMGIFVSILINNAGWGDAHPFLEQDPVLINRMIGTNISALVNLTRLIAPMMVSRRSGRIMNLGSIASYLPGPNFTVYFASKAFVLSFSEGIRAELAPFGVTVTCLCPGSSRTNFFNVSGNPSAPAASTDAGLQDSQVVARKGYKAMMRGKAVKVPGAKNWMLVHGAAHLLPANAISKVMLKANTPSDPSQTQSEWSAQPAQPPANLQNNAFVKYNS